MTEVVAGPPAPPERYDRFAPWLVGSALFLQSLDATIVSMALPQMARGLGEPVLRLNLIITVYLLACAVFIPASGWIADRFGAKRTFLAALVLFTVASVLCGLAQDLPQLLGARAFQGAAAAMIVPVGRLILIQTTPRAELVRAISFLGVPVVLGPVVGPPLGGFIVSQFSWPWIFLINLPLGVVAIWLVWAFLRDARPAQRHPLDFIGFLLSGAGAALVVFAVGEPAGSADMGWAPLAWLTAGVALLTLYAVHARRTPHPILDLSLSRIPTYRAAVIGGASLRLAFGAMPFLLSLLLQLGFNLDPFISGLVAFSSAAAALLMKAAARPIIRRFGFRTTSVVNTVLVSATLAMCALIGPGTPIPVIVVILLIGGFFRSLQFTSVNTLAYADVEPSRTSRASSLASMLQQLSESLGVGLAALALAFLSGATSTIEISDVTACFLMFSVLNLVALPFFMALPKGAGESLVGRS